MTAGFWNVRGWHSNQNSDNYYLRSLCVNELGLDILGIAETHLVNDNMIELEGYRWFGNNRKVIHVRARTGSGGVGFLVKNELLNCFEVSILDNSSEGILWLQLKHKHKHCYLVSAICPQRTRPDASMLMLFMILY